MNQATIAALNEINRQFYASTAPEFDQTRGRAWGGWLRLKDYLHAPLSVLDVGCGNGRFALFLAEHLDGRIQYHGMDNNPALLTYAHESFQGISNLQAELSERDSILNPPTEGTYDVVVLFGVLHHIPSAVYRLDLMKILAERVKAGGYLCFAAWCFYEYERFRERFSPFPEHLQVEQHDYLLDWRRGEHALRYCHYVDESEHEALIAATGLEHILTYRADGSDDAMNRYSLLKR